MKICLIITGLTMGGAERQVCDLADQFSLMGHKVKLISLNKNPIVLPQSPKVIVSSLFFKKTFFGLFSGFFKLRKEIRIFNPDVVHSHMIHANIISRVLRIITPMNILICTAHSTNEGGKLRQLIYRYTDKLNTISTNVTQKAVDTYIINKISFDGRMIAVANGIDESKFQFSIENRNIFREKLNINKDDFLFLAVGRLEEEKDYFNLINAFSILNKKETIKNNYLAIIGDGVLKKELKLLVNELGLNKKIYFLNNQFNVNEWMSACDTYVLSSAWEGFGLVVAEAMLCKRVVIATDCGGVKEVLNEHGFLIPPKSSELLSNAMHKVMSLDSEYKKLLGINARTHIINNYSLSKIANKWIEIYSSYLAGKPPLALLGRS